jgi:hypothetical protein
LQEGYHLIILLDANDDMRNSSTLQAFTRLTLREAILDRHGTNAPATYRRNNMKTPIDGCWISPGLEIIRGGYLSFDQLFQDTDHRGIWIDVSFTSAFGYKLPPTPKLKARKLNCRDPRIMENFIKRMNTLILQHNLLERFQSLHQRISYLISMEHQSEYNTLNSIRHSCVKKAEDKCRKLKMGQVDVSPSIQMARIKIYA